MKRKISKKVQSIIKKNNLGIHLDVACGENKQKGFVGIDVRKLKGVDIIHDLEKFPYPLPDECVSLILCSHYVEHINPAKFGFIKFMDEIHRITKKSGRMMIAMPYSTSPGFVQDPTHINPCNETTWVYFDPSVPNSSLYNIYKPKPWKILKNIWSDTGNMEIVLEKLSEAK